MANYSNDSTARDAAFIDACRTSANKVPNAILSLVPSAPSEMETRGLRILLQQKGFQFTPKELAAELAKLVADKKVKRYTRQGVEYCQRK